MNRFQTLLSMSTCAATHWLTPRVPQEPHEAPAPAEAEAEAAAWRRAADEAAAPAGAGWGEG